MGSDGTPIHFKEKGTDLHEIIFNAKDKSDLATQVLLSKAYDQTYGLYDHEESDDPMGAFLKHPGEDIVTGGHLYQLCREIISSKLPELIQMPLVDILYLPSWLGRSLIDLSKDHTDKFNKEMSKLDKRVKDDQKLMANMLSGKK